MSPGPPGSVALPGLVSHSGTGVSVTVSNGSGPGRALYSPDSEGSPPTPQPPGPPGHHGHQRPVSLNPRPSGPGGDHRGSAAAQGKSGGKKTRWLLCYHMGGGAPSASPSPPSEQGNSQCSTPSPTDHGFKLPNSFSNERPTSLPVALLNCGGGGGCSGSDSTLIPHLSRGVVGESKLSGNTLHDIYHHCMLLFRGSFLFVTL